MEFNKDPIDDAEEVLNPLEGLIERSEQNPGAPFAPEVLKSLALHKSENRSDYENLFRRLKKAGVRTTELDKAIGGENGHIRGRGAKQADILVGLAASANLFHTPDGNGYADIEVNGHRETWPIGSKSFRRWLTHRFHEETGGAPNSEALQSALNSIEARADIHGFEQQVFMRVANYDGRIYLDLCDANWRAVEIDAEGWRIVTSPPVRFRRTKGMLAIPAPMKGGSIEKLRPYLNLNNENDFVLVVTWALAALRDHGPYPLLILDGEQGSAKSTFLKILRMLLDPNSVLLRGLPRDERDLFIGATNSFIQAFDNVSYLSPWLSDALCRLSTSGGYATRELYSNNDEIIINETRPIIMNGSWNM